MGLSGYVAVCMHNHAVVRLVLVLSGGLVP